MKTFTQLKARLKSCLREWLLVLGLVECATLCIKSEVILTYLPTYILFIKYINALHLNIFCYPAAVIIVTLCKSVCLTKLLKTKLFLKFIDEAGEKITFRKCLFFLSKLFYASTQWVHHPCTWFLMPYSEYQANIKVTLLIG